MGENQETPDAADNDGKEEVKAPDSSEAQPEEDAAAEPEQQAGRGNAGVNAPPEDVVDDDDEDDEDDEG